MTIATLIKENDRLWRDKTFRVIDANGDQLGLLTCEQALARARSSRLDLVVVAEKSDPPVARIMDFGKLVFEQKKKDREQKKKNAAQKVKEIKFSLRISAHDYENKLKHALAFFSKGHKVKVTIQFAGRELSRQEMGYDLFAKIVQFLAPYATPDATPKLMGRTITVGFTAVKGAKFDLEILNFNPTDEDDESEDVDDEIDAEDGASDSADE